MVAQLRDIVAVLADANPIDKRIIYDQIGVKLTYRSDGTVHVAAGAPHVLRVGVGGTGFTSLASGGLISGRAGGPLILPAGRIVSRCLPAWSGISPTRTCL